MASFLNFAPGGVSRTSQIGVVLFALLTAGQVLAAEKCSVVRVTEEAHVGEPRLSHKSRWMVFSARGDFFSEGSARQLYLLNMRNGELAMLTKFTGPDEAGRNRVDQKGNVVAFVSRSDLTGENPDFHIEVFVLTLATGELRQITHTEGLDYNVLAVESKGKWVLVQTTNESRERQLVTVDLKTREAQGLVQELEIRRIAPGPQGKRILIESQSDPLGTNKDGNPELFLLKVSNGKLLQITDTNSADNRPLSLDASGRRIVFISDAPKFRLEGFGLWAVVVYDTRKDSFESVPIRTGGPNITAVISGNGKRIFSQFGSTIEIYDLKKKRGLTALAREEVGPFLLGADHKGKIGVITSALDLVGDSGQGSLQDLYLVSCP